MSQPDDVPQIETSTPAEGSSDWPQLQPALNQALPFRGAGEPWPPWPTVMLLAGFAIVNFLFLPLMDGGGPDNWLLIGLGVGIFPAEMLVMAIWLVWTRGSFLKRLAIHWAIGLGLLTCWFLGLLQALEGEYALRQAPEILRGVGLGLLPVSLAVQLPLWPLRTHLGWRIVRLSKDGYDHGQSDRPLSIGDILAGTAVTALSITAIRFAFDDPNYPRPAEWFAWGIGLASAAGISLITAPVALPLLLRKLDVAAGMTFFLGYVVVAMIVTVVTISIITQQQMRGEPIGVLAAAIFSFAATAGAALLIARAQGFRLSYRGETPPSES